MKKQLIMKSLIAWYSNKVLPTLPKNVAQYCADFNAATNAADKAELLIFESIPMERQCHQWYLKSCRVSSGQIVSQKIISAKPWTYTGATTFEDLYNYTSKLLGGIPYVGPLTYYDIALRLAHLSGNPALLPRDYVYISSLPVKAFKRLIKKGYIKYGKKVLPSNIIKTSLLASFFGTLEPRYIENLLCCVAKSIERLEGKRPAAKSGSPEALLDIEVRKMKLVP